MVISWKVDKAMKIVMDSNMQCVAENVAMLQISFNEVYRHSGVIREKQVGRVTVWVVNYIHFKPVTPREQETDRLLD